ncbi:LysR family transcriptional regulator [Candidatus Accumulibacter sp. ACC003]|uniref:LysR family transcriptional regulator n=1 Tax=Candidatus Accumulibacter sp. ACC003 TaxID=2823334 RepID=UPI0025C5EB6D|nr:LysR family transcriptional regulator [Candidatus Accumulibacter sp. ACC003]
MDMLSAMQAFVKIVDSGSLTAAAEALAVSQPSMVRTLAALEREVGVRLLNRTTRRMALTDEGREYCARCRAILAAVDDAQASLSARRVEPRGKLRITASVPFGRRFVTPVVIDFLAAQPQMHIELLLLDRLTDLLEEGIDLAVRLAPLPDSSMVAVPIGHTRRLIVGSAALLARRGAPQTPADLAGAPCVSFTGLVSPGEWEIRDDHKALRLAVHSVLTTNQIDAAVQACVQGLGWGQFFDYHVRDELRAGTLLEVLADQHTQRTPAHIVYPQARLLSPNVRAFIDFAAPKLRLGLGDAG